MSRVYLGPGGSGGREGTTKQHAPRSAVPPCQGALRLVAPLPFLPRGGSQALPLALAEAPGAEELEWSVAWAWPASSRACGMAGKGSPPTYSPLSLVRRSGGFDTGRTRLDCLAVGGHSWKGPSPASA